MKHEDNFEKTIRSFCRARQEATRTTEAFDKKVMDDALPDQQHVQQKSPALAGLGVRRITMRRRMTALATAVVVVAVILSVCLFHQGATPAYAVTQTIEAMKKIETVYMKGEFYKQGEFECWMRFDGDPDRPTHVWLGREGSNLCKICSPEGVFGLNKRTHRVHYASRDERGKSWIPKFGSVFENAVRQAGASDTIQIDTGTDMITIRVVTPQREQDFIVDGETKLPTQFTTVRDDNPMEMMRRTLAVRSLTEIRYNEQPPEGIFDKPADAVVVDQEVDCMVDPDSGLPVDGMTHEEACLELARQASQAMVDVDKAKLESLTLFFRLWPEQLWEQVEKMKASGQWVQGYHITGQPYQEGDHWYVPTELKLPGDETETQTVMIKFYNFDGATRAFSIGSKERGVVD
jgi:hypothetical protein